MGDKREIPNSWRTAADFHYRAASGRVHAVHGEGRLVGAYSTLGYLVGVALAGAEHQETCRLFSLSPRLQATLGLRATQAAEGGEQSDWLRRLRRLALDVTMNDLDADAFSSVEFTVEPPNRHQLDTFEFRECKFQQVLPNGDLVCTADVSGDTGTTRAICEACGMPDPWERCKHITHVETRAITSDSVGLLRRQCGGLCQINSSPEGGGLVYACRAGERKPDCFVPSLVVAPGALSAEKTAWPSADVTMSNVNTAWKARYGFMLFLVLRFDRLTVLRSPVASSPEYHHAVLALSEIMDEINEESLRGALPAGDTTQVQPGHTVSVLEAFLRYKGLPNADPVVRLLRDVHALRNLPPTHPADTEAARTAMKVASEMGFPYPVAQADWPRLWQATLGKFVKALDLLLADLEQMGKP